MSAAKAEPIAKEAIAVIARDFTKLRLVFTSVLKWLTTEKTVWRQCDRGMTLKVNAY
jgi:hypothetical protein